MSRSATALWPHPHPDFCGESGSRRRKGTNVNRLIDAFEGLFAATAESGGELAKTANFTLKTVKDFTILISFF